MKKTFHNKNTYDEQFSQLKTVNRSSEQKERTMERLKNSRSKQAIPYNYYLSITAAAVIIFILFIPTLFFPTSNEMAEERERNEKDSDNSLVVDDQEEESFDEEAMKSDPFLMEDLRDLDDSERIDYYWFEEPELDPVRLETGVEDERFADLISELEKVEVIETTEEVPHESINYIQPNNYFIEFIHDEYNNLITIFIFLSNGDIFIETRDNDGARHYIVNLEDSRELVTKVEAIFLEEIQQKREVDGEIVEKCGWDNGKQYQFRIKKDAKQPVPCIQPIFEVDSNIYVDTFRGEFNYREVYADNMEQGVSVHIFEKGMGMSYGTRGDMIKETEEYIIHESTTSLVNDNGDPDIIVVASGELNDNYDFLIGLYDRNEEYTEDEIVIKIEKIISEIISEEID